MKINILQLVEGKPIEYNEDIDLSYFQGDQYHVRSIKSCHMSLKVTNYGDLYNLSFNIKGEVLTTCAYTLEEIPYKYSIKENVEISDSDDEFKVVNGEIDLDPILITLIVSNVPFKVVKEGAKLPENGEYYSFLKEEDAESRKKPSPFDALDDLELDE